MMSSLLSRGRALRAVLQLALPAVSTALLLPSTVLAQDYDFKVVAMGSEVAPEAGGDLYDEYFEPWALNKHGELAFITYTLPSNAGVIYAGTGEGAPRKVVRSGETAPDGATLSDWGPMGLALNDRGELAFNFFAQQQGAPFPELGLYRSDERGQLSAVLTPGVTEAPGFGPFLSSNHHPEINKRGDISFAANVPTSLGLAGSPGLGNGAFVADRDGTIRRVAAPGDLSPEGRRFDQVINPASNDRGDVVFAGHVADEECVTFGGNPAMPRNCGTSIYLYRHDGEQLAIARQGASAPGGGTYRFAWNPLINERGDVAFIGDLSTPPTFFREMGLYLHSRGETFPIVRTGDALPGGGHLRTVTNFAIDNYSLNDRGEVAFNASLDTVGTTGARDNGLYVWSEGELQLVARTGTVVPGVGTLASLQPFGFNGAVMNDRGQVAFVARLDTGRVVLLIASPRPCAPDEER